MASCWRYRKISSICRKMRWLSTGISAPEVDLRMAYDQMCSQGRLIRDPRQVAALENLQQLAETVLKATDGKNEEMENDRGKGALEGLFGNFFSFSRTAAGATASTSVEIPFHGVYLYGTVGCGKTMLMDLFFNQLKSLGSSHAISSKIKRTHFHAFMLDVHQRLHKLRDNRGGRVGDPLPLVAKDIVKAHRIICFDELLVLDVADAMILRHLFKSLFQNGAFFVATSNAAPKDLYKNGINRSSFIPFIDLLEQQCKVHNMSIDVDYRSKADLLKSTVEHSKSLRDKGVFLNEKITDSDQARKIVLRKILGNEELPFNTRQIELISGRTFNVQKTWQNGHINIAEFSFEELFGSETRASAADYLGIADVFDSIIIQDLDVIEGKNESAARRLITALDVWYDLKKHVILISKVRPDEVFLNVKNSIGLDVEELEKQKISDVEVQMSPEGGSTSQFSSTVIHFHNKKGNEEEFEWSATGLKNASLAQLSKNRQDEELLFSRALSRLHEIENKGNLVVLPRA